MRCSKCKAENPAGKRFCSDCGAALGNRCPRCGSENPAGKKFCGDCGAALDSDSSVPVAAAATPPGTDAGGERRHLTVLFCDLVGSTEIVGRLDPEEWRESVTDYHRAAAQAIERYGGHVAQYLGDGVMAYFGYPEAHDNDAERAARAGLAILDAISKLNEHPAQTKLDARVGIDSGGVVVGAGAGKDADVFGDTPNIAARVQAAAEPGTVVITNAAYRLVSGLFVVEDRGPRSLKGIEKPVQLYRVVQPSGVRGRFEAAAASRGLTPFVGREEELRLLMSRLERALDGEGQVALIIGEAGIGKSRLVQRFHEQIASTPHSWAEAAAGPFYQNTPFYPVTELLRDLLAWRGDESAEEQLAQLEARLIRAGLKPAEALPLIASLLNLPRPAKYPTLPVSPEQQRRRLLATLVEWLLGAARVQPTVIAIEDLHWADPSTLELIQLLVEQGATTRLLLLFTARPEFHAQWPLRAHHTQINLNRLSARQVRTMVEEVAARKALSDETVAAVVERTGGVPLFVEELTRAVLENDDTNFAAHEIPATLHDSLTARLDRLGSAKEVIQFGAVIGNEFSYRLLQAVYPISDESLQHACRDLVDAELLYVRGIPPETTYRFKHALIQDAAYGALLRSRRKEIHLRIAETLVRRYPETPTSTPELLAHHYTQAESTEAIAFWQKAGQNAVQRSANVEAVNYLTDGLKLLEKLPDTPERDRQEIMLRITLGTAVVATQGYSAQEVANIYTRARQLSLKLGDNSLLFPVLRGLWAFHLTRAEYRAASELGKEFLDLARRADSEMLVEAHFLVGFTSQFLGEFVTARAHCGEGISIYSSEAHRALAFSFGVDPGINCLSLGSLVLWCLGYPDQALQMSRDALLLAQELHHPFSTGWALIAATWLRQYRREDATVREQAKAAIKLGTEHGFPLWSAWAGVLLGWAIANEGSEVQAINQIRDSMSAMRTAMAAELAGTHFLGLLAEVYGKAGEHENGLEAVAEALVEVKRTGERFYQAELIRVEGELRLMREKPEFEASEDCFRRAILIARNQGAKSWEVRATTSLARLLAKRDRRVEARAMLAEIYGWFTEGFDTADLKDAKALLDELSKLN
jgi:class 3 adenylate cyclase/predicted ATPase